MGALAEGLGIRAVARVFAVAPPTVLAWWGEVAEPAAAFSQYCRHEVRGTPGPLDALLALLSAVQAGAGSAAAALTRRARSPPGVWGARAPVTKRRRPIDVGDRTRARAQRVLPQVGQVLAPGWVPLCLTEGFQEYTPALLPHYGQGGQPARQRAQGPTPQPRWLPAPGLL